MPLFSQRRNAYWDLDGVNVRRERVRRRILGAAVVVLAAVLLALFLYRLYIIDAAAVLNGPTRPLVMSALICDALACGLVLVRELRHPVPR